ncbi:L-aspartate oxidase [Eubacteriaceae bacterium CHKCI005]|nr:L-aspartate oxidase [Eubacteriaceae bacterium CHKCI005]
MRRVKDHYDVLIAGSGVAGLHAALQFPPQVKVLVLCKKELLLSNSALAQGGVAAVVDKEHDTCQLHIKDTMIAGGNQNNPDALEVLVNEGAENVLNLLDIGVDFDRDETGGLQLTLEGGHSRRRILHHKDSTGREMMEKLILAVKAKSNVDIEENCMLADLKQVENGFLAYVLGEGHCTQMTANYCILATGGIGRVYQYTTNSAIATGDGIALAHRMGAKITDLHLVQFHPTAFAAKQNRERFLISESVRGEGAVLLNNEGKRFMDRYDERLELAPRDVVSRSIMKEARRVGSNNFYLDISFQDADYLKNRFPTIYGRCLEEGVDITKDWIPVFPCQHYLMGGIHVDLDSQSSIDRLYACGECSHTGVHGNNRLASNSLLEALVFSRRAARHILNRMASEPHPILSKGDDLPLDGMPLPSGLRTQVRDIMQSAHFVVPNPVAAREGMKRVKKILAMLESSHYAVTPDFIETKNITTVAMIILEEVNKP